MNKKQLLELLEPLSDDVEIFVHLGSDDDKKVVIKPVSFTTKIQRDQPPPIRVTELWLGFEEVK